MNDITARLNSGALHAAARRRNPDRVCDQGNIHHSTERALFVRWRNKMKRIYGADVREWPPLARTEYRNRYVPSH